MSDDACSCCGTTWGERHFNPCPDAGHWFGKKEMDELRIVSQFLRVLKNELLDQCDAALTRLKTCEEALKNIAEHEREKDEWQGAEFFDECTQIARKALEGKKP